MTSVFEQMNTPRQAWLIAAIIIGNILIWGLVFFLTAGEYRKRWKDRRPPKLGVELAARRDKRFVFEWSAVDRLAIVKCVSAEMSMNVPDGVSCILKLAFSRLAIVSIELPESLITVGYQAFCDCKFLREVKLPPGMRTVASYAFQNCSSLTRVEYPYSAYVAQNAFRGCDKLETLVISGHEFEVNGGDGFNDSFFKDVTAVFAAEEDPKAEEYVSAHGYDMLKNFISRDKLEQLALLLGCRVGLSAEDIDKSIDLCAALEKHEMYLMLVQYKRDRLGFDTDGGTAARFEL